MFRPTAVSQPVFDLVPGHGTVAAIVIRMAFLHAGNDRFTDLHGHFVKLFFHRIGAIMTGTAFDSVYAGVGDQLQQVAGFHAHILHSQMAGNVIGNSAQTTFEIGLQEIVFMTYSEIFERVVNIVAYLGNVRLMRKHQRELLFEHQHTGWYWGHDIPAVVNQRSQPGDIELFGFCHSFQVTEPSIVEFEQKLYRNGIYMSDDDYVDPMLSLYDTDGTTLLRTQDDAYWYDSRIDYYIALFLVCAEEYSYLNLHDGYCVDIRNGRCMSKVWLKRFPEYDRPLGPPKGPAKRHGYVYTREFEHASVRLDVEAQTGRVEWRP